MLPNVLRRVGCPKSPDRSNHPSTNSPTYPNTRANSCPAVTDPADSPFLHWSINQRLFLTLGTRCGYEFDQKQMLWKTDECLRIFARFAKTHTHTIKCHLLCLITSNFRRSRLHALALLCAHEAGSHHKRSSHAMPTSELDIRTAKLIGSWSVFRRRRIRDHVNKPPSPIFREAPSP